MEGAFCFFLVKIFKQGLLLVLLIYSTLISLQGLVFSDANAIKENSVKLGAGEDLYVLFAGILTMRPWNKVIDPAVDHLVIKGTDGDRSELQVTICESCF